LPQWRSPAELYKTFSEQLAKLPASVLIYPGHDYIENNLRFTLNRERDNESAREMLDKLTDQDPNICPRSLTNARYS
jgi:hydroxyacylglutathione hydrolase